MMIMLALAVAMLLGGGASSLLSQQLDRDYDRAQKVLGDAPQKKYALEMLKSMRNLSRQSIQTSKSMLEQAVKTGRDHERPTEDVAATLEPYVQQLDAIDREFLDRRDQLRGLLSREQWDKIFVTEPATD